jgi:DNA-binding transcriptional regulator LsrR (DeoR family)
MNISLIGNSALRIAIQRNLVSFPSQMPAFMKRPGDDTQQRIAHLYFARGWPVRHICARYGLSKAMVQRLVSEWRIRAVAAGYIQDIHPEDLDMLLQVRDEAELADSTNSHEVQLLPSSEQPVFTQTTSV